jgi:uncharacterized protein (TIGR02246 family)
MLKAILYLLFLFPVLSISGVEAQSQSQQDEERAIKKVIEGYYTAANSHDPKKMAEFFAVDGDMRTSWDEIANNRQEIENIFAFHHAKLMKNAHVEASITFLRQVKPNIAFIDVDTITSGMTTQVKTQYAPMHHHVIFLLVKREGSWQILEARPF